MLNNITAKRWQRYGNDRLYIYAGDTKIGWHDLNTGDNHPDKPEHEPLINTAVDQWTTTQHAACVKIDTTTPKHPNPKQNTPEQPETPTTTAQPVTPTPTPVTDTEPWIDFTTNTPGQSAHTQALKERANAPIRTTIARALGVHTNERAWRIGAKGEQLVARELYKTTKKNPAWKHLHAIPIGTKGSDIDHLIIGPGGVYTANTKHHPKADIWVGGNTLLVNGHKTHYIRNARYEAERATTLLTTACGFPVHAHGLIITVNANQFTIKSQPSGVHVTWRTNLTAWLLNLGTIYDPDTLNTIYDTARRSTTWDPTT